MITANAKVVDTVVRDIAGADVLPLVKVMRHKKNISEFKLAQDIKQEINHTRNMLYRLYDLSLVSFVRKKDKKKGWYIYYWTFEPKRANFLLANLKKKKMEALRERLSREKRSNFFICDNRCVRLDFEQSTEFNFKCPECGHLLDEEDNAQKIKELEKNLAVLEKELKRAEIRKSVAGKTPRAKKKVVKKKVVKRRKAKKKKR